MRRSELYPHDQHPWWCDLSGGHCEDGNESPNHVGRTSQFFAQQAEGRVSLHLSSHDYRVPIGTRTGDLLVRLRVHDGGTTTVAEVEMDLAEITLLANMATQYIEYLKRESLYASGHETREAVIANGPA